MGKKRALGLVAVALLALSAGPAIGSQGAGSLSGDEILFAAWKPVTDFSPGGSPSSIYALDPSSLERQRLTTDQLSDWDPEWSPDRTRIAFVRGGLSDVESHSRSAVMVMDRDGQTTQLTSMEFFDTQLSWSPDGEQIVFRRLIETQTTITTQLFVVDMTGSETRLTSGDFSDGSPEWSPDGSKIAFVRNGNICLLDVATGDINDLSGDPVNDESEPAWSPDGEEVAYSKYRFDQQQHDIYATHIDDMTTRAITRGPTQEEGPVWSRDGSQILFQRWVRPPWKTEIFSKPASGGALVRVTRAKGYDMYPTIGPVDHQIAYIHETKDYRDVFLLRLDTGQRRRLTRTAVEESKPDW